MGYRGKVRIYEGQRVLGVDPHSIPYNYDEFMAKRAARRRYTRIGQLALGKDGKKRTAGFRSITGGLWVPHSAGENTAVIAPPDVKLEQNKQMTKQRVKEKFEDTDVSWGRVVGWAAFAAINVKPEGRLKFKQYYNESRLQLSGLRSAHTRVGNYDARSIWEAPLAIESMEDYAIALKGFIDHKWMQKRWVHKYAAAREIAHHFIKSLTDDGLTDFYDEAVWSAWTRNKFWEPHGKPPKNDPYVDPFYQYPFKFEVAPDEDIEVEYYDDSNRPEFY